MNKAYIILAVILLGVGIFTAGKYFNTFQVYQDSVYGSCDVKDSASYAMIPFYGYYSCQANSVTPVTNTLNNWQGGQGDTFTQYSTITAWCPTAFNQVDLTKQCTVSVNNLKGNTLTNQFSFIMGSSSNWQTVPLTAYQSWTKVLNKGDYIVIRLNTWTLLTLSSVSTSSLQVTESHIAYGLWQYERGAAPIQRISNGCRLPASTPGADICINCKLSSIGDSGLNSITNKQMSTLPIDGTTTYLKDWVVSTIKSAIISDVDGSQVMCSSNTVYNIGTTKTELGCGAYPLSVKKSVSCCPGDKMGSAYCSNQFQWVQGDAGCIKGGIASITACNGAGAWVLLDSYCTYQKATTCNMDGTCTYQTVKAPCCASSNNCPQGAQCVVDNNNPANNYCKGGILPCGAEPGKCVDRCTLQRIPNCNEQSACIGENGATGGILGIGKGTCCAGLTEKDGICIKPPPNNNDLLITFQNVGIIILVILVIVFIIKSKTGKKRKR